MVGMVKTASILHVNFEGRIEFFILNSWLEEKIILIEKTTQNINKNLILEGEQIGTSLTLLCFFLASVESSRRSPSSASTSFFVSAGATTAIQQTTN